MGNLDRADYVYLAKLAEQGERYDDMTHFMKEFANVSQSSKLKSHHTKPLCLDELPNVE